jgi:hypothetical protein
VDEVDPVGHRRSAWDAEPRPRSSPPLLARGAIERVGVCWSGLGCCRCGGSPMRPFETPDRSPPTREQVQSPDPRTTPPRTSRQAFEPETTTQRSKTAILVPNSFPFRACPRAAPSDNYRDGGCRLRRLPTRPAGHSDSHHPFPKDPLIYACNSRANLRKTDPTNSSPDRLVAWTSVLRTRRSAARPWRRRPRQPSHRRPLRRGPDVARRTVLPAVEAARQWSGLAPGGRAVGRGKVEQQRAGCLRVLQHRGVPDAR